MFPKRARSRYDGLRGNGLHEPPRSREPMMGQTAVQPSYSLDDYLRAEDAAALRHEYVAGGVFAMAGGSERHNQISGNVYMRLRAETRGSACRAFIADMKLRIDSASSVYYPDVMLVCDADDAHPQFKTAPCVIVEVLSPSTAATDRREKRKAYFGLPSLQAYVLADSEARSVEYFLRGPTGFDPGRLDETSQLLLPCGERRIGLTLDDVYEDVDGLSSPL